MYAHPPAELVERRQAPWFRYGDALEITGTLQRPQPFAGFDYPAYLESLGIYAVLRLREDGEISLNPSGEPAAGRLAGMRAGAVRPAPQPGPQPGFGPAAAGGGPGPGPAAGAAGPASRRRGGRLSAHRNLPPVSHFRPAPGHPAGPLPWGALSWLLGRHTPWPLLLTLAAIWFYVLLSGAPASVVRAALMGSVYLGALALGRPRDTLLPSLALSAVAMTALEPRIIAQISFQLSFAAMCGIALALPWQESASQSVSAAVSRRYGLRNRWAGGGGVALSWLAAGIIVSAAATLATLPLVAFHFGRLPLLGIPATLLAAPLLPFALAGGLAAALAGLVHPWLGQLAGGLALIPLAALLELVALVPGPALSGQWHDARPGVGLVRRPDSLAAAGRRRGPGRVSFRVPGPAAAPAGRRPGFSIHEYYAQRRRRAAGRYLTLAGIALIVLTSGSCLAASLLAEGDGQLHVHFFDVGQGDSALIVTPEGRQILVDGGPAVSGATRAWPPRSPCGTGGWTRWP